MKKLEPSSNLALALSRISANSTSLSERLHHPYFQNLNLDKLDQRLIDHRIQNWCKISGSLDKLTEHLQEIGLDLVRVRAFLGTVEGSEDYLPAWLETLSQIIQLGAEDLSECQQQVRSALDPKAPLPFEDFYCCLILIGRQQLHDRLSSLSPLEAMEQKAYNDLENSLLKQLTSIGTETLFLEFKKFRQNYSVSFEADQGEQKNLYNTFIESLLNHGGLSLFQQYPVLARLLVTTVESWVNSTAEFIQRLHKDIQELDQLFCEGKSSLGKVQEIKTSLSNPHHRGGYVLALTFGKGIKIVYKPKGLGLDLAFNQFLEWCNQQSISLPFKLLQISDRQDYGWVEFISHQPCNNNSEVQNFYTRVGMLLGLLYLLGAKDCHSENLVACGENPILIDTDALMTPLVRDSDQTTEWLTASVLSTGILPIWQGKVDTARIQDDSILGNTSAQQVNAAREWQSLNTDQMHLVARSLVIPAGTNVVILDGKPVSSKDYIEQIVMGFEEISNLFIQYRDTLLENHSPITVFKALKSRFILRPAIVYGIAMQQGLSPSYLRHGVEQSIVIEHFLETASRSHGTIELRISHSQVQRSELQALQQRDIPYFSTSCDDNALEIAPKQFIQNYFQESSYQRLLNRLERFEKKTIALQVKLIRLSFYVKYAHLSVNAQVLQGNLPTETHPPHSEAFLQAAIEIGNHLAEHAIWNGDNCDWLALEYMNGVNRYQILPLNDSLYTGRAGVSLFLAALAQSTNDLQFRKLSLGGLSPFCQSIRRGTSRQELMKSDLGLIGLGGTIYSLVKVSQFLQEPRLIEDALQAAQLLTPSVITADRKLDVMWGATGVILGLVPLYQATQSPQVLEALITCGEHLLTHRSQTEPRAWITISPDSKVPLTGFSHGAAGTALALIRLYEVTQNSSYLQAAEEGIAYERSVFDRSQGNWPDYRSAEANGEVEFLHSWCHGAPGIGLARLGGLATISEQVIHNEINIALETTQKRGITTQDIDFLCCGRFGKTELFIMAAQRMNQQHWLQIAKEQAKIVLDRIKQGGEYAILPHLPNSALSPSFYRGISGIGYELLRLGFPDFLPSVLVWE